MERLTLAQLILRLTGIAITWIGAVSGYFVFLQLGIHYNYNTSTALCVIYLLTWSAFTAFMFRSELSHIKLDVSFANFALVGFLFATLFMFYVLYVPTLTPPSFAFALHPGASFLNITSLYLLPKMIDVSLQHVLIWILVISFSRFRDSVPLVSVLCAIFFGAAHVGLLVVFSSEMITVFTAGMVSASAIFPYLMMRVRNGFLYTYLLHWGFYLGITCLFWFS